MEASSLARKLYFMNLRRASIEKVVGTNQTSPPFEFSNGTESSDDNSVDNDKASAKAVSKKINRRRIKWSQPHTVMIVTKPGDKKLGAKARELVTWLLTAIKLGDVQGLNVYVDKHLEKNRRFDLEALLSSLPADCPDLFDFVITLGGDGTVLYTSWLFQKVVPAVIPFHLGSLGFLTPFDFVNHKQLIQQSLEEGVRINMRMRFSCTIYRHQGNPHASSSHGATTAAYSVKREKEEPDCDTSIGKFPEAYRGFQMDDTYEILNDLVVDRGPSASMSQLELYGDGSYLTTVQADGLALATPTGSTAYSLAAGGSLVHPEIPALLISPICPHSLSFRPMLLPDSTILFICVPFRARGTAWASFDGRGRVELRRGDFIRVEASKYPFPTVCASGTQSKDWFNSLNRCLLWNQRTLQKSIALSSDSDDPSDEISDTAPPSFSADGV
ncbi:hypothetical protein L0F63_006177 [Massospora cicadina]|nr:hypothetical protein L0F63_006177 [Massospora cicadina]